MQQTGVLGRDSAQGLVYLLEEGSGFTFPIPLMNPSSEPNRCWVYVAAAGGEAGIEAYRFNARSPSLECVQTVEAMPSAFYLSVCPETNRLYAVGDGPADGDQPKGRARAFDIDPETGLLTALGDFAATGGTSTCYVSTAAGGRLALTASFREYGGYGQPGAGSPGSAAAFLPSADGALGEPRVLRHEGSGPHPERQTNPHPHCFAPAPDSKFAYIADLGADRIWIYRIDPEAPGLTPADPAFAILDPGTGPRHLAFHPSGHFAYVITEITDAVLTFERDGESGALRQIQQLSALPPNVPNGGGSADIHVHPNGQFLYASNRGNSCITVFEIDPGDGRLAYRSHQHTGGDGPRGFALHPSGQWLLAANQQSKNLVLFAIDPETGALQETAARAETAAGPITAQFLLA